MTKTICGCEKIWSCQRAARWSYPSGIGNWGIWQLCEAFKLYRLPASRCIFDMENVNMTICLMAFFVFFMCFSLLIVCPHLNMVVWAPLEMFIPPLLDPYCAPTLDTKDSNIRELGKIGSDKTKLYDPRPGFHLYSLLQTRLDESKQHEPAPFWILKLLLWRRLHQFCVHSFFSQKQCIFQTF